jgi:16S rRNA (cytosine967-C5)-methyltransferase
MKIVPNLLDQTTPEIYSRVHALVFETVRHQNILNRIIHTYVQRHLNEKLIRDFRNLLRVITYLLTLSSVSNENNTWKITRSVTLRHSPKNEKIISLLENFFVSLKNWQLESLLEEINDPEEKLAVKYSHPTWLVRDLVKFYGLETTIKILKSNNQNHAVYIRLNLLNNTKHKIIDQLIKENVKIEEDLDLFDVLKVISWETPLPRLSSFNKGLYYMQNKGSAFISHILDLKEGDLVLDACAAPGGKTTHLSSLLQNSGKIIALDNHFRRMKELVKKVELYKLDNVFPLLSDLRMGVDFKIKFDKILVDAPCSGSGTFSSRPDSKWRIDRHHIKWLSKLQYSLLSNVAPLLKESPESSLVYSTCSLLPLENEDVIDKFLKNNSRFELQPQKMIIGVPSPQFPLAQRLFPHLNQTEGFTIFKMGYKDL